MADQPQAAPATPAAASTEKQKTAAPANCATCNKPVKKLKRFYRDGKFYCAKKCYKDFLEKQKGEAKQ